MAKKEESSRRRSEKLHQKPASVANDSKEPPAKKARMMLDNESGSEDGSQLGGVELGPRSLNGGEGGFKVNEEYARRFEHNKKREELHRRKLNASYLGIVS